MKTSLSTEIFQRDFLKRRKRNPSYSLRAYARDLGISVGATSQFLSGKRAFSLPTARRVIQHLSLSPADHSKFLSSLLPPEAKDFLIARSKQKCALLEDKHFRIISDGEHFALLSLMRTETFRSNPTWMAKRLGISVDKVEMALVRLQRAGLVTHENGKYRRTESQLTTTSGIPSLALRRGHKQVLRQALHAVDHRAQEERQLTTTTIAVNPARLEEAKALILEFHRSLSDLLEEGPKTEVFHLNIQLVKVTE